MNSISLLKENNYHATLSGVNILLKCSRNEVRKFQLKDEFIFYKIFVLGINIVIFFLFFFNEELISKQTVICLSLALFHTC